MSLSESLISLEKTSDSTSKENYLANGSTNVLPGWAEALVSFGCDFVGALERQPQARGTLAICLPRIEFAALFTALGMIKWKVGHSSQKDGLERLRSMVGTWVHFEVHGNVGVGRLESVPEDQHGYVRILEFKGRRLPCFEDMTVEEKINYTPPLSGGTWSLVDSKWWSTIKPTGKTFSEERGARSDQVKRVALAAKDSGLMDQLVGPGAEHWLMTAQEAPIAIFGCKSRLNSELQEEIPFANTCDRFRLSTLLRPLGSLEYAASSHIRIDSCIGMCEADPESICIIEAGRLLEDNLLRSSGNSRVILLARNAPSYEQIAHIAKDAFHQRKADFVLESMSPQLHIKALSFIHK